MLNIILQKLKDQYRGIIYYLIGLISYAWMMLAMFPTIGKSNFEEIMKNYPPELMKFFGGEDTMAFSTVEGFLSMEYLSFFFILIIIFYIGSAAGSTIAGSIEKHQMDFTLSQPISRTKLVLGEAIVSTIYLTLLTTITTLSMWILAKSYDVELSTRGLAAFSLVATLFLLALYGIAIFFSSFMKSKMATTGTIAGITIGFYMLTSLGNIVEKLEPYKTWSIFNLYNPQKLLTDTTINWQHTIILAAIFLIGLFSSLIIFNRRDI